MDEGKPMPSMAELSEEQREVLTKIKEQVAQEAARIAQLGKWPDYIQPGSLTERIPNEGDTNTPGFDAGIACALDLIPRDMQELPATLHANYSKEAVMQIRNEAKDFSLDSPTVWWLAACYVCSGTGKWDEGQINAKTFLEQVETFKDLSTDKEERSKVAEHEFHAMTARYSTESEELPGIPFGKEDGCIQGAYIDGYPFGVMYSDKYGIYFIGTYEDSLGLEDFQWSDKKDEKGRPLSGGVFGSKQFVKCADLDEVKRALEVIQTKLDSKE